MLPEHNVDSFGPATRLDTRLGPGTRLGTGHGTRLDTRLGSHLGSGTRLGTVHLSEKKFEKQSKTRKYSNSKTLGFLQTHTQAQAHTHTNL